MDTDLSVEAAAPAQPSEHLLLSPPCFHRSDQAGVFDLSGGLTDTAISGMGTSLLADDRCVRDGRVAEAPTLALQRLVFAITGVALEAARRSVDRLPGVVESLEDVVVYVAGTPKGRYGHFLADAWRSEAGWVPEIVINASHLERPIEDLFATILHESAHAYAASHAIRDTSRDGRYHNRLFAEVAIQFGAQVVSDDRIGHRTAGLSSDGRDRYGDLLGVLHDAVRLFRDPQPVERGPVGPSRRRADLRSTPSHRAAAKKYVMAVCGCRDQSGHPMVVARIAAGRWRPDTIFCSVCRCAFIDPDTLQAATAVEVSGSGSRSLVNVDVGGLVR